MERVLSSFFNRFPSARDERDLNKLIAQQATQQEVATALEFLLIKPLYTLALGGALRSCGSLLRLLSFLVERRLAARASADDGTFAAMLVTVLQLAPQCSSIVQRYLSNASPPHELVGRSGRSATGPGPADSDLLFAALRALQLLPELKHHPAWAAGPFMLLLQHQSPEVRWASVQAVALLLNMSDASRAALEKQLLTRAEQVAALSVWQAQRNAVALEQASMWLHVPQACEHCREGDTATAASGEDEGGGGSGDSAVDTWTADAFGLPIARGFVEICNIELACRDAEEVTGAGPGPPTAPSSAVDADTAGHCFVVTETVCKNMEAAALVLCQGLPLLLEGPPGAGKTRMVEELAVRTGNGSSMVRVHLDDQMDAKSLLGAYVCTAVPGEFAWQPGPLTQAVSEGRWVLVEDINMAPGDVLAALVPLLESKVLQVPSRGLTVRAAPGFQIIATVTSAPAATGSGGHGAYGMSNMVKELLGGLWRTVRVDAPTDVEQMRMLATAYAQLLPLLPAAVGTLCLVQAAGGHDGSPAARAGAESLPIVAFQLTASGPKPASCGGSGNNSGVGAGDEVGASQRRLGAWHALADAAMEAEGLKRGALALHLGRHFSLRDIFKWCRRMMHVHGAKLRSRGYAQLLQACQRKTSKTLSQASPSSPNPLPLVELSAVDPRLREAAFIEAVDCFVALVAQPEARGKLLKALAVLWAAPASAPEQWEHLAKPQLSVTEGAGERRLVVGRVALPVAEDHQQQLDIAAAAQDGGSGVGGTFARTGHAMRVMERIAVALSCNEPTLLVGETGTGKTTMLSRMAALVGAKLVSFNLSQQTDSSDLLGGFKPVEPRDALGPLLPTFNSLIRRTWTRGNNDEYLGRVAKLAERRKWSQLLGAFRGALAKLHDSGLVVVGGSGTAAAAADADGSTMDVDMAVDAAEAAAEKGGKPSKKRRVGGSSRSLSEGLRHDWRVFATDLAAAERAAAVAEGGFAFAFVEGVLIKALRNGWWLLLDEINLAPAEVLERLAGLLETAGGDSTASAVAGSVTLLERGDTVAVPRHPNFRLVAAMNPATDAGKHELPVALRNRFTEMWVPEPTAREDLAVLVAAYLAGMGAAPPVDAAVDFYLAAKAEADNRLVDGAGQKPAYNLRTLARALGYARASAPSYGVQRALYDGTAMAFLTQLTPASALRMEALIIKHLLPGVKNAKALLRAPPEPSDGTHVLFEAFWLERGPLDPPAGGRDADGSGRRFVTTTIVRQHLTHLARAALIRRHPILLQGPTSAGKTSLVAYLAAQTGHTFLRINNHEHTDLQEYLGSYVSDSSGRLVFREGPLVTAVRRGWWVVLDELNLAPTEVLEALNRLLDDNRELLVPELGEVIRPHPHFMLFATQNPPGGVYAGRKVLSRAFRSRFLELHIDDIPDSELVEILEKRCAVAPSYAAKLVAVQRELQRRRNASSVFAGKHGFITPRDLFRWGERGAVGYEALAQDGALLLGERLRSPAERAEVLGVLEKVMNVKVNLEAVFAAEGNAPLQALKEALHEQQLQVDQAGGGADAGAAEGLQSALQGVVWTRSMRRMYTLVERCLRHSEPVLLVGETGTGKTTVCQLLAIMQRQHLHILNCNQHTETSDFLGGFRPTRGRERAVVQLRTAAARVAASPLLVALKLPPPQVPEEVAPQGIALLAAAVAAAVVAVDKALSELDAKGRKDVKKALRGGLKKAAAAGIAGGRADFDEQLKTLKADAAAAAAAAMDARAPFSWADGPLVTAMRRGDMILVDEINLAEDAVLERLNSVLEQGRTLTLAERGGEGAEVVVAAPGFRLLATMNPGGDFGKKELSPALANRFTTIWVPAMDDLEEMHAILEARLADSFNREEIAVRLLHFWREYLRLQPAGGRQPLSVRDLLSWVSFINATAPQLGALPAYVHGAHLTLLDGIGLGVGLSAAAATSLRASLSAFLSSQIPSHLALHASLAEGQLQKADEMTAQGLLPDSSPDGLWGIPPFFVPLAFYHRDGPSASSSSSASGSPFTLRAPTTARNAFRLLRAMQLRKAVLLEGSPGVGKTSLIAALAKAIGQTLVRINLSEQTDMMDLLGADLPAAGGAPGQFAWCDGALLGAIRAGHWVLLDELNLAGQSVLEGLNALLDHRSEVFIPELGARFACAPGFRLFAAQNPLGEGGGRKGLPRSFLNRFTRVSVELLHRDDLLFIAEVLHPRVAPPLLRKMVDLLDAMQMVATAGVGCAVAAFAGVRDFATAGGPWEFNLRDLLRWCDLVEVSVPPPPRVETSDTVMETDGGQAKEVEAAVVMMQEEVVSGLRDGAADLAALDLAAQHFAQMLFYHRLRTAEDRDKLRRLFTAVWGTHPADWSQQPQVLLSPETVIVGRAVVARPHADSTVSSADAATMAAGELQLLPWALPMLESLLLALSRGWMALLVGGPSAGKTTLARTAAALCGRQLQELSLTSGTDTSDLLGSFEQLEPERRVQEASSQVHQLVQSISRQLLAMCSHGAGVNGHRLGAARELQAAWSAHTVAMAAMERQADAPAPVAASAARVEGLRCVMRICRGGLAALAEEKTVASTEMADAATAAEANLEALASLLADEAAVAVGGRFEWVDGVLTRAIERGGWILLEGANLCNPTVLDRLNPLLEPHGVLYLNECGHTATGPRVIQPHPEFRLILALDPRHGEVSRAMRNRGIEIFLLPPDGGATTAADAAATTAGTVVDAGIEAVIRAQGIAGKQLLRALARGHMAMGRLCACAHKRPPGLREASTAANLAAALLSRGWGLAAAVRTGWTHVYMRGQGFSSAEAVEAQAILDALVRHGISARLPPPPAAGGDNMEWVSPAATSPAATPLEGGDILASPGLVMVLVQSDGSLCSEDALRMLHEQPLLPNGMEASVLAAPSAWPLAATVQQLAGASALASAQRDVSLLRYILGAYAAATCGDVPGRGSTCTQWKSWSARLHTALRDASGATRNAAVRLLQYVPTEVVAAVLHGSGAALDSEMEVTAVADAGVKNALCLHLQQLAWAVAQCLAQRACLLDEDFRALLCDATADEHRKMAYVMTQPVAVTQGLLAEDMASLVSKLVRSLSFHPMSEQHRQAARATFSMGVMPRELQQLQPLDLRYSQLLQPYLPGVPLAEWAALQRSAARLRCTQVALGARLLLRHVAEGVDAAVSSGAASPLQLSYWRFLRPEERAAVDACHPVVDCLYSLLSTLADVEDLLLLPQPTGILSESAWEQDLEQRVATVQTWRNALWRACHGALHLPLAVQTFTDAIATVTASRVGAAVAPLLSLDVPQLTWRWMRTDKALTALLVHSDVHKALGNSSGGSDVAARLEYARAQTRDALGLAGHSAKPLAWRLCGKPVLPSTLALLGAVVQGRALAAAAAAVELDSQGRPVGLQAVGVSLDAAIAAAVAASKHSVEDLLADEAQDVRQQVAMAVALTLCVDPKLRRALSQGVAMLGAMPLLEALRPGQRLLDGSGTVAATATSVAAAGGVLESLGVQGVGVVSAIQESMAARVNEVAAGVLACPSEDEWMMRHGAAEARSEVVERKLPQQQQSPLLLPSSWMVSRTCQQLQLPLLALQDCYSLRRQVGLLAAATHAAVLWAGIGLPSSSPSADMAPAVAVAPLLARQAASVVASAMCSSSRSATDLAACQQLQWVLDELEQYDSHHRQQHQSCSPAHRRGGAGGGNMLVPRQKAPEAGAEPRIGIAGVKDGLDLHQLCQVVLPALAHEMWLTWHVANWRNSFSSGLGGGGGGKCVTLLALPPAVWTPSGAAAALDAPVITASVMRVLRSSESQVQSKAMRLRQLRGAVATLLTQGGRSTVGEGPAEPGMPSPEWAGLGRLLCQLLLAHVSTLPSESLRAHLRSFCERFTAPAAAVPPPLPHLLCDELASILLHSDHAVLRELLQPVVLPAVAAVVEGFARSGGCDDGVSDCGSVATSAQRLLYGAAQLRVARDAEVACRGRAWLLVGLMRLHLVTPPPGIDPAGKYALKRRHLEGVVVHDLQPEILVRKALQALPGGPSEGPLLEDLEQRRAEVVAQAQVAAARCVPRPHPSQYMSLQHEVTAFAGSLAAPPRVLALLAALSGPFTAVVTLDEAAQPAHGVIVSATSAVAVAALQQAELWNANARAWCDRFGEQYAWYPDLVQPVQLAVYEMLRGLALLTSASSPPAALVPHHQLGPIGAAAAGLLRFPSAVAIIPATATANAPPQLHPSMLAESQVLQLIQQVASAAALQASTAATAVTASQDASKLAQAADLAGYDMQLRATRVALLALAREVLARGRAAGGGCTGGGDWLQDGDVLESLERLLGGLVEQWSALKAYEEATAEEEAQQFKTKVSTATFLNDEQEEEATYHLTFPDHFAPFRDVTALDPEDERLQEEDEEKAQRSGAGAATAGTAATAAQARSSAARQLLDGELLTDVVHLHASVYGVLASVQPRPEVESAVLTITTCSSAAAFLRSYELGSQLMAAVGFRLDQRVDEETELGHLFRLCLEHNTLNRATAATAADAAAAVAGGGGKRFGGTAAGTSSVASVAVSRRRGGVIFSEEDGGVDIQKACVEEISLLQEPVSALESRLRGLLDDYPEHPLLLQMRTITLRVLAMPLTSPLKTALTGLELLMSRVQLWEETAACFVSLKALLGPLAALATRWRRLELISWKGLLQRVATRHAAGAHRSWFHLHRLLAPTALHATADTTADAEAATALAASGVPVLIGLASVPAMMGAAPDADPAGGPEPLGPELEILYRRVASTLESFIQTSTLGEFRERLAMLHAFACHVEVRRQQPSAGGGDGGRAGPLARPLEALLHNLVRYFGQFAHAIDSALAEGMAPLEKDLQDFVQLARWDDRGYYAMKASTEKAQRYLHRLSRRAEEVLRQPAATALAAVVKGMGVGELAAAAAVATRFNDVDAVDTDKVAEGAVGKQKPQRSIAKPRTRKLTAAQVEAEAEAMDLAAAPPSVAADDGDKGGGSDVAAQWTRISAELQMTASHDATAQQILHDAAAVLSAAGGGSTALYLLRLPQLMARLTRVVAESLQTRSPTNPEGCTNEAPELMMTPDELVATAIFRSHELRADVSKGARMRKRHALAELFETLEQQGLSRRQTSVPPYDRDVAAWFKHVTPAVELLWQGVDAAEVKDAATSSWRRADEYYFRAMSRLQKLWQAAQQPHRDLSMQEVSTSRRLCEHVLYVARRQRDALGEAASAVAVLVRLSNWMRDAAEPSTSPFQGGSNADGVNICDRGSAVFSLNQTELLAGMRGQKQRLDQLVLLGSETCQLLDACMATRALPAAQAQLTAAFAAARAVTTTVETCKCRLDAALISCSLKSSVHESLSGGDSCLFWVTRGSVSTALHNCQVLVKAEAELASEVKAVADAAASYAADAPGAVLNGVPALRQLHSAIAAAADAESSWLTAPRHLNVGGSSAITTPELPADFVVSVEGLVRSVLVWAQPPSKQQPQQLNGVEHRDTGVVPASRMPLVQATSELEAVLKLTRARELACIGMGLLRQLAAASPPPLAAGTLLCSVAPLLHMAAEALRLRALQLLSLHRSTSKLSYVITAVLATLVEEGYCVPEEGKEVEGGDGPGEFKEMEGTGLGDGTGAKDISDQLENQDQLLGAQQRGAQPQEEPEPQGGETEEDRSKGIEMDDDFEGQLQDVPMDERDRNRDSEDEDGDSERIDQQMGDVGDNDEVVDERLWDDKDQQEGDKEQDKQKKEDKYEQNAPIQVEDKTDLEYAPGQQDEHQDASAKEPPKKEQKQKQEQVQDEETLLDGEGEEEGKVNEDTDDKYEDKHHAAPQAAEEELQLPEDMNLDGAEGVEEGEGADEVAEQPQKDADVDVIEAGAGEEGEQQAPGEEDKAKADGDDEEEGGEDEAVGGDEGKGGGEDAEMQDVQPGGIGEVEDQPPPPEPDVKPEQDPEVMAVDRDEQQQHPDAAEDPQQQLKQAGPRGADSGAPTKQPVSTGAAHGAPEQEQQPLQPAEGDAASRRQQQQVDMQPPDPSRAPDSAPEARQVDAGLASEAERGAPAPISGGDKDSGPRQQQRGRRQQQEPNPLRNLGDALEHWRANLAVRHEVTPAKEDDAAAAGAEELEGQQESAPLAGAEFQYLGAEERSRVGDTQALAPATEEQAAHQAEDLDDPGLLQQRRDEQQQQQDGTKDEDGAVAMEEDIPEDISTGEQQRAALVSGPLPPSWGGQQRQSKLAAEGADGRVDGEEEELPSAEELLRRREGEDGEGEGDDLEPSRVVARLANATLHDDEAAMAAADLEAAAPPPRGLTLEQMDALRQQLDERLRGSAGAAAEVSDLSYGSEVWSRCEALVSGLAGELTEQLRLILEPTLASKLAGDYRTGKRINMKKVIGYIASHFRRDKIWLRRNRPDKRRYQVLLACDDSRSMAENGCGGFALEALALICKAMSRLEVGQVGVLKFGGGEGVVPLHPLDAAFSDSVGPSLAARLTFRQDNTIADRPMLQLMASLDHILAMARHSCGAGGIGAGTQDLAQLVLILADGRFHEKESLHAAVREAAAKRGVCLAFIVLDNPSNSLLDMQSVSFAAGKPVFTKYLDSFPFPYYIVLRDIASLPATLADLLRQWFQLSTA